MSKQVEELTADNFSDVIGKGTTVVDFWAPWCPPCVHEFPHIVKLHREYHDKGLDVMLVSMDREDQRGAVNEFLSKHGVDWQTYIAEEVTADFLEKISPNWSGAIPTSFFYTSDGKLQDWWEGARSYDDHENKVNTLTGKRTTRNAWTHKKSWPSPRGSSLPAPWSTGMEIRC